MLKRSFVTLLVFVLVAVVFACEDISVTQVTVATLEVEPEAASIQPTQTIQLSVTAFAASGARLPDRTAEWTALDPEVATVNGSGLVQGVATGSARIRATIEDKSATASIQVAPSPQIALSQPAVQFSATAGGSTSQPVTVGVTNGGGGNLTGLSTSIMWVEGSGGWLEATLSGTSTPTTLSLRATPGSLPPGGYVAEVTVRPSGSGATPGTLTVNFRVDEPPPSIGLSPGAVGFASSARQDAPPSQNVRITNGGGGSVTGLNVSISYASGSATGWLAATLDGSSAPTDLVLRVNPQGLATGVHDAEVRITASGSVQAAVVQVRYRYGEAPPEFAVSPGTVSRTVEERASPPAPDTVRITNAGTGTLDGITLSVEYSGAVRNWVDARLSWSRAPALLVMTMDPEGLAPGTYEARARLASSAAINSPASVLLQLRVEPRAILPSASKSTLNANPQTVHPDQPSTLSVRLRDADGNVMTTGGDGVFLTTSLGTLSRTSGTTDDNGRFTATLTSSSPGSAVVSAYLGSSASDPLISSTTVTVVPEGGSEADPDQSTLEADPSRFTTDESSEIEIQLRDADGDEFEVEGLDVFLVTTIGELDRTSGTTDDNGRFTATLTSSSPGSAVVSAYLGSSASDPLIGSTTVTVVPEGGSEADPDQSTLEADPSRFTTDESSEIEIQLRDADGDEFEFEGLDVFLVTTIGELDRTSGTTDDDGEFETRLRSSTVGTGTVTAYLGADAGGPSIGSVEIRVDPGEVSVEGSTIEATPAEITVSETSSIVVQLRDAAGNAVREEGEDVYLRTSRGRLSRTTGETDHDGRFVATLEVNPSDEGTVVITAWLGDDDDDDDDRIGSVQVRVSR